MRKTFASSGGNRTLRQARIMRLKHNKRALFCGRQCNGNSRCPENRIIPGEPKLSPAAAENGGNEANTEMVFLLSASPFPRFFSARTEMTERSFGVFKRHTRSDGTPELCAYSNYLANVITSSVALSPLPFSLHHLRHIPLWFRSFALQLCHGG